MYPPCWVQYPLSKGWELSWAGLSCDPSRDEGIWAMIEVLLPVRVGPEVWSPEMGRGARAAAVREAAGEPRIPGCGEPGSRGVESQDPRLWESQDPGVWAARIPKNQVPRLWRSGILGCGEPRIPGCGQIPHPFPFPSGILEEGKSEVEPHVQVLAGSVPQQLSHKPKPSEGWQPPSPGGTFWPRLLCIVLHQVTRICSAAAKAKTSEGLPTPILPCTSPGLWFSS